MAKTERYPFPVTKFGGLRVSSAADEVGYQGALNILNVDLDLRGSVRTRNGATAVATSSTTTDVIRGNIFAAAPAGSPQNLLAYVNSTTGIGSVRAFSSTGTLLASQALTNDGSNGVSFTQIGTATAGFVYFATLGQQIRRWDGTTFTAPAALATMTPQFVATATDGRLVAAKSSTNPSRVWFSDPGAPETFGTNNWVDLTPGDGESITGVVAWRELLFVFKSTKFFVFYGNTTDGSGNPIFNYRAVNTGVGAFLAATTRSFSAIAPSRDGVYFLTVSSELVRTTGGPPESVSRELMPLSGAGSFSPPFTVDYTPTLSSYLSSVGTRLYMGNTAQSYSYVYDTLLDEWLVWQFDGRGACACGPSAGDQTVPMFGVWTAGATSLLAYVGYQLSHLETSTDAGVAITSRYRSGFYTVGNDPSQEATIVQTIIDGTGTPTFSVSRDFATSLPTTGGGAKATVTLGTFPAVAQGRHTKAQRGRRFSFQIEATSGAWRVDSLTHHVRGVRDSGLKTT